MNALLSSEGGDGGVVNDRQVERQNYCDASLFNKERSRQGQTHLTHQVSSFVCDLSEDNLEIPLFWI